MVPYDDLITCIAFLLHIHVGNKTNMKRLHNTQISELTPISREFLDKNKYCILHGLSEYGCTVSFTKRISISTKNNLKQVYEAMIEDLNIRTKCSDTEFRKSQEKLFEFLYENMQVNSEPRIKYCNEFSYTWSINNKKVCIPNLCNKSIETQWSEACPVEWKGSTVYAYLFRQISVPLHEVFHINQDHSDLFEDEWEASYLSLRLLFELPPTKQLSFAMSNMSRFLLFHESLVRNLSTMVPKKNVTIVEKWHGASGKTHTFSANELATLTKSIIHAEDKRLNTYAKNLVALLGIQEM